MKYIPLDTFLSIPYTVALFLRGIMSVYRPNFSYAPNPEQAQRDYGAFFEATNGDSIQAQAKGNLSGLVDLAEKVAQAIHDSNPFWDRKAPDDQNVDKKRAYQWHFDQLAEVKSHLYSALLIKKVYYLRDLIGQITRFVLKLFCMWNNGTTAAVRKAEDFLLLHDTGYPVKPIGEDLYVHAPSVDWVCASTANIEFRRANDYSCPREINVKNGTNYMMPRFMTAVPS